MSSCYHQQLSLEEVEVVVSSGVRVPDRRHLRGSVAEADHVAPRDALNDSIMNCHIERHDPS